MESTNVFFEWVSLIASLILIVGWIIVFKRWWPRMIVHMGPVYTYLIPVMLISGISLRVARASAELGFGFDILWYIVFGVWLASSAAALYLFLHREK